MKKQKNFWENFNYYICEKNSEKLIFGFDDLTEAKECENVDTSKYKLLAKSTIKKKKIDISNINNWTNYWPKEKWENIFKKYD